jgi:hypothetical protein
MTFEVRFRLWVVRGRFDFSRHYHLLLDDETEE